MWVDTIFTNVTPVLVGCFILLLFVTQKRRDRNYPPGPMAWPVLGNWPLLRGNMIDQLDALRKKYGDVYSLYMGNKFTVFVHGLETIKEILITRGDEFIDRPKQFLTEEISKGLGILRTNGVVWKEQRRFSLHTLRYFGFGRVSLEGKVLEEVEVLIKCVEETGGLDFPIRTLINTSVSNVICSIVFGARYEHDDPEFGRFFQCFKENFALIAVGPLTFLPFLKYIPGDLFKYRRTLANVAMIQGFISKQIEEHKKSFDPNNLRDFIDGYLAEMSQHVGTDSSFSRESLGEVFFQ